MLDPSVRRTIERAEQYLQTARRALSEEDSDSSLSRAYYALYHMTVTLVDKRANQRRERWDHIELHKAFLDYFCKRGCLFNQQDGRDWDQAKETRMVADYGPGRISRRRAARLLEKIGQLVQKMQRMVEENA